jgi:uncharacterized protein
VHVSEISTSYITDPNEVLKLNQHVKVKVMEVDVVRKRIALSMKQLVAPSATGQRPPVQRANKLPPKSTELPMNDALEALKQKFGR